MAFIENFRQFVKADPIYTGANNYHDKDLPAATSNENTTQWTNRVAIPFSVDDGDPEIAKNGNTRNSKRLFGIMYVPEQMAYDIESGNPSELKSYGAELMDGTSLSAKGLQQLYEKYKDSFSFEFEPLKGVETKINVPTASEAMYLKPRMQTMTGVFAEDRNKMEKLRANVANLQKRYLDRFPTSKYSSQNDFIRHLRETRRMGSE